MTRNQSTLSKLVALALALLVVAKYHRRLLTAIRLFNNPSRFLDVLIFRMYWSGLFRSLIFKYCDQRDAEFIGPNSQTQLPPVARRFLTCGTADPRAFVTSGERSLEDLQAMLSAAGKKLQDFESILDFGCGCGRVLNHLRHHTPSRLSGSDVDKAAIDWCEDNYGWADFRATPFLPPSNFDDAAFDLIYLGSVFTHIDGSAQDAWLSEFRRILRPGGILIVTVHGPTYNAKLPEPHRSDVHRDGMLYLPPSPGQPDGAFHTPEYIYKNWTEKFEILEYIPLAWMKTQDSVIMKNKS